MPNSLLELATKAAEKTAEKAQALKGLFGAPKRAVLGQWHPATLLLSGLRRSFKADSAIYHKLI